MQNNRGSIDPVRLISCREEKWSIQNLGSVINGSIDPTNPNNMINDGKYRSIDLWSRKQRGSLDNNGSIDSER